MGESKQLLHFVFGGELQSTDDITFKDLSKLDFVGMYPNYAEALKWMDRFLSETKSSKPEHLAMKGNACTPWATA